MEMQFFVVKVELKDGTLRPPFTLYARDQEAAQMAAEKAFRDEIVKDIQVGAIDRIHEKTFGRSEDDRLGLHEHISFRWTDPGPLRLVKWFGR